MDVNDTAKARLPRARFVLSAGTYAELPAPAGEEYCVLGRSNVGKSTFVNHVFGDRGLARVSKRPGKTVCVNLFDVDNGTRWADLPGYGYAEMPQSERDRLSVLIHEYCTRRPGLRGVVWLLDIRHPGMAADREVFQWLRRIGKPVLQVLTKADKLSRSAVRAHVERFRREFAAGVPPVVYSAMDAAARRTFWQAFADWTRAIGTAR